MKYIIKATNQFKKDLKAIVKRGLDRQLILDVIELLAGGKVLPTKYKDHNLTGILWVVENAIYNPIGC